MLLSSVLIISIAIHLYKKSKLTMETRNELMEKMGLEFVMKPWMRT